MSINPQTGTIRWTPTSAQIGPQTAVVTATDTSGLSATQSFTVNVVANAAPPQITTTPSTAGTVGDLYLYQVGATTSTKQPLSYTLVTAPAGMTINASTGAVSWTPSDIGTFNVSIGVTDVLGQGVAQSYSINVTTNQPAPLPPVITTQPVTSAVVGTPYSLQIVATDPQNEALTYNLTSGATGMSINASGLLTFTPPATGTVPVTVVATDTSGLTATLSYTLTIHSNTPPTILSTPPTTVTAGLPYQYDIQANGNGDSLSYTLLQGPTGMSVDNLGRITWQTTAANVGTQPVVVDVTSSGGLTTPVSFDLSVQADTQAPTVSIQTSTGSVQGSTNVPMGTSFTVVVRASDNVGVTAVTLTANGVPVALIPLTSGSGGTATLSYSMAGPIDLVASTSDAAGNVGTADKTVIVVDPSVTEAPVTTITSPSNNGNVTAPIPVTGTVSDPQNALASWTLTLSPDDSGELPSEDPANASNGPSTVIASGTTPITNGTLGTLDPTLLQNGAYVLTLTAINNGGLTSSTSVSLTVSGNLKLGALNLSFNDMTVQAAGVPIIITRSYSSLAANTQGDFGYGWSLSMSNTKVQVIHQNDTLSDFGDYVPMEDGDRVIVTLPNGTKDGFTFEAQTGRGPRGRRHGLHRGFRLCPGLYSRCRHDGPASGQQRLVNASRQRVRE